MTIRERKEKEQQLATKLRSSMKELARHILADVKTRLEEVEEENVEFIGICLRPTTSDEKDGIDIYGNWHGDLHGDLSGYSWHFSFDELKKVNAE